MRRAPTSVAVAGEVAPLPTASVQPVAAKRETLRDQLQRELGRDDEVALLGTNDGLVAIGARGGKTVSLAMGNITDLWVDPRANVVWFLRDLGDGTKEWSVLDLEAAPAAAEPLFTFPSSLGGMSGTTYSVSYPEGALGHVDEVGAELTISLESAPTLRIKLHGMDESEETRGVLAKGLSPAVTLRLLALRRRGDARGLVPKKVPTAMPKVMKLPADSGCVPIARLRGKPEEISRNDAWCGDAESLTGTPYWRVVVGVIVGAGTFAQWRLYDPGTKKFPTTPFDMGFSDIHVSPSGKAAIVNGSLIRLEPTIEVVSEASAGAWLAGGIEFPARVSDIPTLAPPKLFFVRRSSPDALCFAPIRRRSF